MDFLPPTSSLGKLEIVEIYEYYDYPLLFSCKNTTGSIFLAVQIEESSEKEVWLLVNMSQERFFQIRSGGIDLYDAFKLAETGSTYKLTVNRQTMELEAESSIKVENLTADQLPMQGEKIELQTNTAPIFDANLQQKAIRENRELIAFELDFKDINKTEAPASIVGEILSAVQELVNAVGQAWLGRQTERGKIPGSICQQTEMRVQGLAASSFVIELAAAEYSGLLESLLAEALNEFVILLNSSNDPEKLKEKLALLETRATSKYLHFLKSIQGRINTTKVFWASPKNKSGEAQLSKEQVNNAIQAIQFSVDQSTEELSVVGILVSGDIDSGTFEIREVIPTTSSALITYKVKAPAELINSMVGTKLGIRHKANIVKITTMKPLTGETDVKFELLELIELGL